MPIRPLPLLSASVLVLLTAGPCAAGGTAVTGGAAVGSTATKARETRSGWIKKWDTTARTVTFQAMGHDRGKPDFTVTVPASAAISKLRPKEKREKGADGRIEKYDENLGFDAIEGRWWTEVKLERGVVVSLRMIRRD